MKTSRLTILLAIISISTAILVPRAFGSSQETNIGSLIQTLFTNQTTLIIFLIELLLGFGLGYFSVKTFKNILALIGIFVLGVLLNVWQAPQLGSGLRDQLAQLGLSLEKTTAIATSLMVIFGLTTVLPITVGFVLGLVVGFIR